MKTLIRSAKIIDASSAHHNKEKDILIEDGIIKKIGDANSIADKCEKVFDAKGKCLSIGWFDLHVNFREPGDEYKEDLQSGCKAAASGGFTGVLVMPSTHPPIQSKSEIELIRNKTANELVDVYPAGALSVDLAGKDLSEMYDMFSSGALAFTDDKKSVQDAGLMLRALLYSKNFNSLIMSFPNDKSISNKGLMNEGEVNVQLGLKAIPSLAEEIMIIRDLFLAEYTETKIHFSTISTAKSVEMIRKAKGGGVKVTCDVAAHNLLLDDSNLSGFDTNYKVNPPLRTKKDIASLKEGLKDGTIDCICSDHSPEDAENKIKEFELAAFGIIGLETAFAVANNALNGIPIENIIQRFTTAPRNILSLPVPQIKEGEKANLTLFDPNVDWTFEEKDIKSKSKNTPFTGSKLKGRAVAVFNKGMISEN